jgi:hypothetical protein
MKISKDALKKLSERLPSGSAAKIQQRLAERGIPKTLAYVYQVLDPKRKAYNPDIIDEAIKIAEACPIIDAKELEDRILRLGQS